MEAQLEKQFGLEMGDLFIYFVPEYDISGTAQFRYLCIKRRGDPEPTQHRLNVFSFLEGEKVTTRKGPETNSAVF